MPSVECEWAISSEEGTHRWLISQTKEKPAEESHFPPYTEPSRMRVEYYPFGECCVLMVFSSSTRLKQEQPEPHKQD